MKKISFYTLCQDNGTTSAYLVSGYTDGVYNYYRTRAGWNAIIPDAMVSIEKPARTRAMAAAVAHNHQTVSAVASFRARVVTDIWKVKLAAMVEDTKKQFSQGDFTRDRRNLKGV